MDSCCNNTPKTYDDLYSPHCREAALDIIAQSVYKCEFLKRRGEHFRFCSIDRPDETGEPSAYSSLFQAVRTDSQLSHWCFNPSKCPEYANKAADIRKADEAELERICTERGINYIPPDAVDISAIPVDNPKHSRILGRNYPLKEFQDRGRIRMMPYAIRNGVELPIVCSAALCAREVNGTLNSYLFMQEGKKGSGSTRTDTGKFDIPGGAVEENETFEECAIREFYEEVGATPKIYGLLGVFERINDNNRLIWKAVYTGYVQDRHSVHLCKDSKGFAFFDIDRIRMFLRTRLLKTPDLMLIMNRIDRQMVELFPAPGEEHIMRFGFD